MVKKKSIGVIIVTIIIFMIAFIAGVAFPKFSGMTMPIIYYLTLMFVIVFVVKKYEGKKLNSVGLYSNNLIKQIGIGIGIFLVLSLFTIAPLLAGVSIQEVLNFKPKNLGVLIFFIFFDIFCVGFGEELVFRGYFFKRLNEIFNSKVWGIAISSILFGLFHYPTNHDIVQVITAIFFGVFMSLCTLKIKNCGLISLAIAHGLTDAFVIFLGYFLL
ncbi:CPBP family intramembrane glutamic endopeptidase [Clostridium vincentii]|uniref:CAAX amino terminal protease self-immunity n=1 Tax=Clostridium vincentii TaxID=52704 RepID=A0A2T0BHW2_9CLOT|nr:type II CAAX endopeptidase family protein [Clostridium vincentii]PRR83451.1 CAAX amino terminal protease self- immunity [Clostridium vincentii]